MNRVNSEQYRCRLTGSLPNPPGPPKAPTKDEAAQNLLSQGLKKPPVGFSSTDTGNNTSTTKAQKTLLGG